MSAPIQAELPEAAPPPKRTIPPPPPEAMEAAKQLAVILGETEEKPIIQIARVVDHLGLEKAQEFSNQAQEVYAGEGLLGKDKATGEMRKRTLGGTFFRLVRDQLTKKEWRRKIKPILKQKDQFGDPEEQFIIVRDASANWHPGTAKKVEMTITGRPISVQKQPTFVALSFIMKDVPVLPKGMPTFTRKPAGAPKPDGEQVDKTEAKPEAKAETKPEAKSEATPAPAKQDASAGTKYLVLVATKQWEKVEATVSQYKDDKLVIKGYCMTQPNFVGIVLLALNVNSVRMMSSKQNQTKQ